MRRAKIVATLGPATGTPDRIAALIEGGANVIRVNASHGTAETRVRWIEVVRRAADGAGVPVAVLVDLQGPRIRVGELASSRVLRPGAVVVFAPQELATGDEIPTTYADLARDARPGARILLNDGLLAVEVTEVAPPRVRALVVDGGSLTSHKGMNLPGLQVSAPALTDKDREDVRDAVARGVEYVALSFVRRAEDLAELRRVGAPAEANVAEIEKGTGPGDPGRSLPPGGPAVVGPGGLGGGRAVEGGPPVQKR